MADNDNKSEQILQWKATAGITAEMGAFKVLCPNQLTKLVLK